MYFFEDYAIHGAYWRNSFGYAPSQGCVNVPVDVAAQLWEWAPTGTRVVVHSG
jgi:lipoprotein-anchoring transpeptidase ErfK/SrfK